MLRLHAHVGDAGVGSVGIRCADKGKVLFNVVQLGIRSGSVLERDMCITVIVNGHAVTDDGDGDVDRIDRDITVRDDERHRGEVGVRVAELLRSELHRRSARVGLRRLRCAGEGEVLRHIIEIAVRDSVIAADGMRLAVIIDGAAVTGDGHCYVGGIDCDRSVFDIKCHNGKVGAFVFKLSFFQPHRGCTGIGSFGCCRAAEGEVSLRIQRSAECNVISDDAVRAAVVFRRTGMTDDRNRDVDRINGHIAVRNVEGNVGKVIADIGELTGGQPHRRGTGVGSLHLCLTGKGKGIFRIQRSAECNVIAGDGM